MPRKKKIPIALADQAGELLCQIVAASTTWRVTYAEMEAIVLLVHAGLAAAEEGPEPVRVRATTKGVELALALGGVSQDGTTFRLADAIPQRFQEPVAGMPGKTRISLVPPKPRDPFDEGFTTANNGEVATNTWTDAGQAAEYDAGYIAGAQYRRENPPKTA